ncbi:MAG: YihY/virulence factor BrkB family protein [Nocardioides sp.]|nr:YihY/virulence factor BrkB family protein [Nocardioides sp.]
MSGPVDALDRTQRRFPPLGIPLAVAYKYVEDQGFYLAAIITFYAFIAVFPLLLLAATGFAFLLQGDPELQQRALDSTLRQFPVIGEELGRPEGLQGSAFAVVAGSLLALYGSLGLGTAVQNAMNVAWSVPRADRPNPIVLRFKSLLLVLAAGVAVVGVTAVSVAGRETAVLGDELGAGLRWAFAVVTVLLVALVLTLLFRLAAAREHPWWYAAPGGVLVAVGWQGLQVLSAAYLVQVLASTSSMNQTFGLVLGLVGLIFLAATIGVLGMELNVVIARRLWPRSLMTPFTDAVDLTEADRRAYTGYARAQRYKGFEHVAVTFSPRIELEDGSGPAAPEGTAGPRA